MIDDCAITEILLGKENFPLIVALKNAFGSVYIDVRHWYTSDRNGKLLPGKGLMLKSTEWPETIKAIESLIKESNENVYSKTLI